MKFVYMNTTVSGCTTLKECLCKQEAVRYIQGRDNTLPSDKRQFKDEDMCLMYVSSSASLLFV